MAASCLLLGEPGELPGHLSAALAGEGFATVPVADADAFRSGARSGRYALGFVPHGSPPRDGALRAVRDLRRESALPCVVVGAAPVRPVDRAAILDAGADEVLDVQTAVPEAIARIRAVLRRSAPAAAPAAGPNGWRLVSGTRQLETPGGDAQRLTTAEFGALRLLIAAAGGAVDRDAICQEALRRPWRPEDRSVDGLIKRLRRKLGQDAIQSTRGVGYALTFQIHSV